MFVSVSQEDYESVADVALFERTMQQLLTARPDAARCIIEDLLRVCLLFFFLFLCRFVIWVFLAGIFLLLICFFVFPCASVWLDVNHFVRI